MNGKGDKPRPVKGEKYRREFDRIFRADRKTKRRQVLALLLPEYRQGQIQAK